MRFLKVLKKTRHKATPEVPSTQDNDTNPSTSSLSLQSTSLPEPSELGQRQELPAPTQSLGILAGAREFIIDRPIMGETQQFQLHYHGISPSSREQLQAHTQESSRRSISRGSSDQGHATTHEGVDHSPEEPAYNTFLGQNQNIHIHNSGTKVNVLRELKECTIRGAEYNSAERDPPPRCHPGTRTSIREEFQACIRDLDSRTGVIWMHGPAGVGKSAIMQTVVEEVSPDCICATLFFSRPNQRDDAKKAFTTLAYSLAVRDPNYREYIRTRMEDDPTCLTKSLDDQFRMLFVTPFTGNHVKAGSPQRIVFVDGLDECQNTKNSDNQCRILKLICDSVLCHTEPMPFIWVIASRPEENLKKTWAQIQDQFQDQGRESRLWELDIPVDSNQATQDVELFLHHQFEMIRENYSDLIPGGSRWPSDSDFVKVANKSSGLFVFASTVTNYIADEDPVYRLKLVVSLIDQIGQYTVSADENPFLMIDLLYSSIMSGIPKRLIPIVFSLLGFYQLQDVIVHPLASKRGKIGLVEACNILGLQQSEVYASLRKLRSVIIYPSPGAAQGEGIRFFHASFTDYLRHPSRSHLYHVDLNHELAGIWKCFSRIIKESKTAQGHVGVNVSWLPGDNASLRSGIQKELFRKAQLCWSQILIKNTFSPSTYSLSRVHGPGLEVVIEVFEDLGPAFILGDHCPVEELMTWLDNDRVPSEVRQKVISEQFTLEELDTERLFRSLCATRRYRYTTSNYNEEINLEATFENLNPSHWAQVKAVLWTPVGQFQELVKASNPKNIPVKVVGTDPLERCAIVGPLPSRYQEFFYILPYSTT